MKIGIIGLPQVGKKTLYSLLTGEDLTQSGYSGTSEIKIGIARIRDSRFDKLVKLYKPNKEAPASIDIILLPKFDSDSVKSGEFHRSLEKCDAICHIVRGFSDDSVFHIDGSVNPMRDSENVFSEMIINDLILVEKRLERIALEKKKGVAGANADKEKEILSKMKDLLDNNIPVIKLDLTDEEKKIMSTYQFITKKAIILVLNVDDDKLQNFDVLNSLKQKYQDFKIEVMQISAKIEAELESLPDDEKKTFLDDLNIKESALNQLSALCFKALGLISFFTVGKDEVRQWTTRKDSLAPQAAGVIHSDLERGFIRAEIFTCDDILALGDESKLKETGKFMLKGKDYVVQDGDIMNVRFNV